MNFPVLTEPLPFQYSPSHSLLFPTPSTLWCTHFASFEPFGRKATAKRFFRPRRIPRVQLRPARRVGRYVGCLLYTSDAADDLTRVDLGGRRIIKKKKKQRTI